jgi:hypothetical protein
MAAKSLERETGEVTNVATLKRKLESAQRRGKQGSVSVGHKLGCLGISDDGEGSGNWWQVAGNGGHGNVKRP